MEIIKVPDVPAPTAELCWKQSRLMTRCDRKAGHGGLHSWEHAEPELAPSMAITDRPREATSIADLEKLLKEDAVDVAILPDGTVRQTRRADALDAPRTDTPERP